MGVYGVLLEERLLFPLDGFHTDCDGCCKVPFNSQVMPKCAVKDEVKQVGQGIWFSGLLSSGYIRGIS